MTRPFSREYWDEAAVGPALPPPPPPQSASERAVLIGLAFVALALFLYFTSDRPVFDPADYAPAYVTVVAAQTPPKVPESPESDRTPSYRLRTQPTPAIASEDTTEAQE